MGSRVYVCPYESSVELPGSRAAEFSRQRKFIAVRIPAANNKTPLWRSRSRAESFNSCASVEFRRILCTRYASNNSAKTCHRFFNFRCQDRAKVMPPLLRSTDDKTFILLWRFQDHSTILLFAFLRSGYLYRLIFLIFFSDSCKDSILFWKSFKYFIANKKNINLLF